MLGINIYSESEYIQTNVIFYMDYVFNFYNLREILHVLMWNSATYSRPDNTCRSPIGRASMAATLECADSSNALMSSPRTSPA